MIANPALDNIADTVCGFLPGSWWIAGQAFVMPECTHNGNAGDYCTMPHAGGHVWLKAPSADAKLARRRPRPGLRVPLPGCLALLVLGSARAPALINSRRHHAFVGMTMLRYPQN